MSKFGNFSQFSKDEITNLFTILGIGYFGGSTLLLLSLNSDDQTALFPMEITEPPYNNANTDNLGMISYLFSLKSDFPYHLKICPGYADDSFEWLGGITAYSFSCIRYSICKFTEIIKPVLTKTSYTGYIINMLIFYILPILLNAILMPPIFIPFIALCTSYLGSLCQPVINAKEKKAYVYFFAWLFNWGLFEDLLDVQKFPFNFIVYFLRIFYGFTLSFFLGPMVGLLTAISIWIYTIIIWIFLPFFIEGGLQKVHDAMEKHILGLITLFMLYTLYSAYKLLASPFVYGMGVSFVLILLYKISSKLNKIESS
jgi:hypothetical protein